MILGAKNGLNRPKKELKWAKWQFERFSCFSRGQEPFFSIIKVVRFGTTDFMKGPGGDHMRGPNMPFCPF